MEKSFFELDQVFTTRQLSAENWCEDHFQQTHIRQPNGKYLVRLPLKTLFHPTQVIGRSRQLALNRFHSLKGNLIIGQTLVNSMPSLFKSTFKGNSQSQRAPFHILL